MIETLLRPWRTSRTWRALCYVLLGPFVSIVTFVPTVVLLALSVGLAITLPLALPFVFLLFWLAAVLGTMERSRLAALLDVEVQGPDRALRATGFWARLGERLGSGSRWKEIAHHVVLLPVSLVGMALVLLAWSGSAALLALPAYVSALPGDSAELGLFEVGAGLPAYLAALVGLAGLVLAAPWVTLAVASVQGAFAALLLGPDRHAALAAEVDRLEASRTAAVGSAEAERRRIERDLHDGAQQRLVALALDLGMAKERFETDPEGARALVTEAHEEAKAAIAELRQLVQGFRPAILEDRGLDAALSAVVARMPVPVSLHIDVDPRPSTEVESAVYFIVAEALTNVAKHAGATRASVSIARRGDRLAIDVTDDGRGGAAGDGGTGLTGIADRARALGGWSQVLSPAGGPTTVLVELPCAS